MSEVSIPAASGQPAGQSTSRPNRAELFAFVTDAATETALQDGLAEASPTGIEIRRANVAAAIAALRKMPTPRTLIIDISGEEQPLSALDRLSDVVEPDIRVLLIGDRDDANFYRQVTRGLGVLEYLHKPLQRDMVARYFGPLITRKTPAAQTVHGGRVVSVTGVRGGVGASTVAANLAWHFGIEASRHTVLCDTDMHRGTCAMLLGAGTGSGLRTAIETPERIDELFVERSAQSVRERLHILAAEEKLTESPVYAPGAAARLLEALQRRYNFVLLDLPFSGMPMHRDMMMMAHHRILVMDPSLASVRDTLRMLTLPNGPLQPRRAILVLNRLNRPGGLTRPQVEDALKMKVDVVVPDMPKLVDNAATLGEAAITVKGAFRTAMISVAREVAVLRAQNGDAGVAPAAAARFRFRLPFGGKREPG